MEKQSDIKTKVHSRRFVLRKMEKKELIVEGIRALSFGVMGLLLGSREMLFESYPLGFALLASAARQTPFVLIGLIASFLMGGEQMVVRIVGALVTVAARLLTRLFLDNSSPLATDRKHDASELLSSVFSEHVYLRMMSGALGVFLVGVWKIIEGGFRFFDLFGAIFYLVLTPVATLVFSRYFDISEKRRKMGASFEITPLGERLYSVSSVALVCAFVYSLEGASFLGISAPIFVAVLTSLYYTKRGVLFSIVASLALGVCISPVYAPLCAFCAIAFTSVSKLSLFGGSIASCIAGLVWGIYSGGITSLGSIFPALLSSSMIYCTAERVGLFGDIERFLATDTKVDTINPQVLIAEQRISEQGENIRAISDSFSTLSEIFYNLSSKLKRPTMLDLRAVCERTFARECEGCENMELCHGAEYSATLDVMKKITVQLHSVGRADERKLPDSFRKRCNRSAEIIERVNKSCAKETKKALHNEKTEIFALDYEAIANILNDALAQNEEEFKIDSSMGKKISAVIASEGYGEHSVTVFGKRKLRILARGLDLSERAGDVGALMGKLEQHTGLRLNEPTFELSSGSVNMQTEAKRAFSAESAFATSGVEGEKMCGDTVSIFENKNDYLYALISDGMGTGHRAAFISEMCNVFLRNMLSAGNRMETSLRMLNSVVRARGTDSSAECSATVDLLQLDLYSGALTLVKSGAAPTFVLRRGNVFKLGAPSFPIGILRALDAKQIDLSCEDGDVVVMLSDGAAKDGDDCSYLMDILKDPHIADEEPSAIANKLVRRVRAEPDMDKDDVSIVVVRIKKEVCNW